MKLVLVSFTLIYTYCCHLILMFAGGGGGGGGGGGVHVLLEALVYIIMPHPLHVSG